MPAERLSMRKIREILRLHSLKVSVRQIARSLELGPATVSGYLGRAKVAGLSWPLPGELDDAELEKRLFVPREENRKGRPPPDLARVHVELRKKHMTLALLWQEYKAAEPEGYQFSQFCNLYRRWAQKVEVTMRQEHKGGEKLFVDFSGDGIPWMDLRTNEVRQAELFVAVLGASNYTYVEAFENQKIQAWITGHVHALEYFQGVPRIVVPDQPRTSTSQACRYDPTINPAYEEFSKHYSTCIIPARPRKPRDKAKVEVGVQVVQRWIIAALRDRAFFSVDEVNRAVRGLLEKLNTRPIRKLGRSRRELFEELDKPHLAPLPAGPYELAEWKINVRVNIDYHIEFEHNYYSVSYQLVHELVDVRATKDTVEIFHQAKRVTSHVRRHGRAQHSTLTEHMPRSHQAHAEWTPSRILRWAGEVGPATKALVEKILQERPHPEQGYRACLGILRLEKKYTRERLEKAAARAVACHSHSYRSVDSILKNKLESQPLPRFSQSRLPLHENIRGGSYFEC
jgi:transposase